MRACTMYGIGPWSPSMMTAWVVIGAPARPVGSGLGTK
jgi:hypothetical protein